MKKILFLILIISFFNSAPKAKDSPMNSKKTIVYMLSGLGLDPGIFQRLNLKADEIHHLDWLDPEKEETLEIYAARMAKGISKTEENLILIGHSFGGVLMQEISKIVPTQKIILVSSIKSKKEKTAAFNFWMRAFPIYLVAGQKMILSTFKSWGKHHGYNTAEAQKVFRDAAAKHSSRYFKWATGEICKWESKNISTPIIHIHGTKDKTFPHQKIEAPVILVEGGDHIMVFNMADEISAIINDNLKI